MFHDWIPALTYLQHVLDGRECDHLFPGECSGRLHQHQHPLPGDLAHFLPRQAQRGREGEEVVATVPAHVALDDLLVDEQLELVLADFSPLVDGSVR
jgi:hypothetical protein